MAEGSSSDADLLNKTISAGMVGTIKDALTTGALWLGVYFLGYFNLGIVWVVAPLAVVTAMATSAVASSSRHTRKEVELKKERVLARVQDVPAWVFFPDFERSEWLNKMLHQLWPLVELYVRNLLQHQVEPLVQESLGPMGLDTFQFTTVNLGDIPPRVGGVKTHRKNISRKEIIVDTEVTWASNCVISVDIGRKAATVNARLTEVFVHATARLVFRPLLRDFPLVGGLSVALLENPKIDFDLDGAASVADVPGISKLVKTIIIEQVAASIVMPNYLYFPLANDMPTKDPKCCQPLGVLRVELVQAVDLLRKDVSGYSDPYGTFMMSTVPSVTFKTGIVKRTLNPVWNSHGEFVVHDTKGTLNVEIWDWDQGKSDEFLGKLAVPMNELCQLNSGLDCFIGLDKVKSGKVRLRTDWLELSSDMSDYWSCREEVESKEGLNSALLMVYVDSCKQLPSRNVTNTTNKPCPYIIMSITSQDSQETAQVMYTKNPVFEQGFSFLVRNPDSDSLTLKVKDAKSKSDLGHLKIDLYGLMSYSGMEYNNQPFKLVDSGLHSTVRLHLKLMFTKKSSSNLPRTTRNSPPLEGEDVSLLVLGLSHDSDTLTVTVKSVQNVPSDYQASDSYVKIYLLPERESKKKAELAHLSKTSNNLSYGDQTFTFNLTKSEIEIKCLECTFNARQGLLKTFAPVGKTIVILSELELTTETSVKAFPLES